MKHLIMGTAGHIDHGKTTLIEQLTGFNCDTHKEEQLRGITIHLGFSHLDLPGGNSLGIVDVPGHADFVNTMVSGSSGIDFVLLVIAADSGVMPQTREHLQIIQTLGITHGIIALTKTDLVDNELLEFAEIDIRELVEDTNLEDAPIVKVSARTGDGIPDLIQAIDEMSEIVTERGRGEIFRMFVDRIFNIAGHGTVVTGSVISGELNRSANTYLLPVGEKLRARRLERHGKEVQNISTGDRASINLVGLDIDQYKRGMMVSDRILPSTTMIDARLKLYKHARHLGLWSQVIFLLGTYTGQARIHLIDKDRLDGGEEAIVQIHLDSPAVIMHGDRFVIRNTSSDLTLGGGEVIDAHPLHHRRRPEDLVQKLHEVAQGGLPELIATEVRKRIAPITGGELADLLNCAEREIEKAVAGEMPEDIVVHTTKTSVYLLRRSRYDKLRLKILRYLNTYHKRNPLDEGGRPFEELMGIFGVHRDSTTEAVMQLILEQLDVEKAIKRVGHTWALFDHNVKLTPRDVEQIDFIDKYLLDSQMHTPLWSELIPDALNKGISELKLKQILQLLVFKNKAYNLDGNFIHADIVDNSRRTLLQYLTEHEEGASVATFRDLIDGNRKICLLLINKFDREGITVRKGDYRTITQRGRDILDPA